ncbi:ubiquitin C-terminal hydrolase 12-like isoform X2 [Andrographis paniculata]|uniref:ubiquitin C-terminal hydrolase 12-like isoform X2 n=1 Tax=Andrographis paniculata TaxID=175694 RepID=UPI0021E81F3A|nr:ubiquitin C-terminal hydrolase 12-like isoform X2 [Andrographis paniculata]
MVFGNLNAVPIINLMNQRKEKEREKEEEEEEEEEESTLSLLGGSSQPIEVEVPGETIAEYPMRGKFVWRVENISGSELVYSSVYNLGDSKWRIMILPRGQGHKFVSLYLEVANATSLPIGWSIFVQFKLAIVHPYDSDLTFPREAYHHFNAEESDQGFPCFMPLQVFHSQCFGYVVDDACTIEAEVVSYGVTECWQNDFKKEVEFVGLKNQGATCYLNSLLQTLYYISSFRKVVYQMPTSYTDEPAKSIPLALQRLFYKLQYSKSSVATNELTGSFGWNRLDVSNTQHDVQEINRLLCEALEEFLKGTAVDGAIKQLFEGHHKNYIECIYVDYSSSKMESFYDLQLDVKGCRDVYASLDKFVEVEYLDNDNKYHAEHFGLQDARKGILFMDFPPVLQLHLKRFEYDVDRGIMVKINDRYEFPIQLDLDKDDGKYLSPEADRTKRNLYALHSVLVHVGGIHGGHYYAFIRPDLSNNQWYKFDDEQVTRQDMETIIEGLYGSEEHDTRSFSRMGMRASNAYMLVYIRESDKEQILCDADENDIAIHLKEMLRRELGGKKEIAETDAHAIVKVATDDDIFKQIGSDTYFDLVDFDKVKSFHVRRSMPAKVLKEVVAKKIDVLSRYMRFWVCAERKNGSCRPLRALQDVSQSVEDLTDLYGKDGTLKLFVEVELGSDSSCMFLPCITKDDILLFFKVYDPETEKIRYAGRLFVNRLGKLMHILDKLNELADFDAHESIEIYEEIGHKPHIICEPIDNTLSFRSYQIGNGDIVCYQKSSSPQIMEQLCFPDIPTFFKHRHNIQEIRHEPHLISEPIDKTLSFRSSELTLIKSC